MTKRKIYLPSIANIGASSAAGTVGLVDLPLYYKYHAIGFEYLDGGSTPQDIAYSAVNSTQGGGGSAGGLISDIALKINSDVKRIHSAMDLDQINAVNGTTYARQAVGSGANMKQFIAMNFSQPWRRNPADEIATAATLTPAFGVNSAQVSITLGAAMPATGSLVLFAVVEPPDITVPANGPLTHQVQRQQIAASGTSIDITTLPQKGAYQAVHMINPTGACVGKALLDVNGTRFHSLTRKANVAELIRRGMNPANSAAAAAYGYNLVLDDDDPLNSALPAAGQNFVLHLDFYATSTAETAATASGNITAIIELVQFGW
jgi:hypothetical protein